MRPVAIAAALLLATLAAQGSFAYLVPDVRAENRQILIAAASEPFYNPTAPSRVTTGTPGNLVTVTVTTAQAIEMHLDFLDRYGIQLARVGDVPPSSETNWPEYGQFLFDEKGYRSEGAACPTVVPLEPVPPATQAAGVLTTEVSQHSKVPGSSTKVKTNFLWRWDIDENTRPLSPPESTADEEWMYGGNIDAGWELEATGYIDYLCREEPLLVYHQSFVQPTVNRTE